MSATSRPDRLQLVRCVDRAQFGRLGQAQRRRLGVVLKAPFDAAEAVVFFDRDLAQDFRYRRKRGGHLFSKMRYVSAQLLAYIENGLWLEMAEHANRQAARFAKAVEEHAEASLQFPVQANEVFVKWTKAGFDHLESQGIQFLLWPGRDDLARFVFGHSTSDEETSLLVKCMR